MKRKNLTRDEVFEVWQSLRAGNRSVSGLDIREKTLGGSLSTIYKYLREFEAAALAASETSASTSNNDEGAVQLSNLPKEQLESGIQFLKSIWMAAWKSAESHFADKEAKTSLAISEKDSLFMAKQAETSQLLIELEEEEGKNESLELELTASRNALLKAQSEIQILKEQFTAREKVLNGQIESRVMEIEKLRNESNTLREKISIIGELQALKSQFEIREKEYKDRIQSTEKEMNQVRNESNMLRERAVAAESKLSVFEKNLEVKKTQKSPL